MMAYKSYTKNYFFLLAGNISYTLFKDKQKSDTLWENINE